ncbi:hypothetical protein ALC56_08884 [Trachymyrmex septentrionalis]|uniref:Uncharacterized protein n=1 Tax=Trachymyrmex septentrionalis TaxID=34720 RepID=A0A195F9H5_9HYME|nr:hypothetical protein ALC56_08884 [Trachymyrmex septentrionalis]
MHLVKAEISCKVTQCKLSKLSWRICELRCWRLSARWPERIMRVIKNVGLTRSLTVHEPQIDSNYGHIYDRMTLEKMYLLSMRFSKRQGTGPPVVDSGSTSNPPVFINQHGEYERLNVTIGTTDTAGDWEFTTRDNFLYSRASSTMTLFCSSFRVNCSSSCLLYSFDFRRSCVCETEFAELDVSHGLDVLRSNLLETGQNLPVLPARGLR